MPEIDLGQTSSPKEVDWTPRPPQDNDPEGNPWIPGSNDSGSLNFSANKGFEKNPEQAARVLRLQEKTGLDADLIERNIEEVELESAKAEFNPVEFRKRSPAVARWLANSPNHVAVARKDLVALGDLEKLYYKSNDPLRPLDDRQIDEMAEREGEASKKSYESLSKGHGIDPYAEGKKTPEQVKREFVIEAGKRLRAEEAFIGGTDPAGAREKFSLRSRENPIFFLPFLSAIPDTQKVAQIYVASKKYEEGTATPNDLDLLFRVARMEAAANRRDTTLLGDVGSILTEIPAFGGEFALTGGAYRAGKSLVLKGSEKTAEVGLRGVLQKVLKNGITARISGAALQTAAASTPRIAGEAVQRATSQSKLEADKEGIQIQVIPNTGEPFSVAIPKAIVSQFAEIASERSGKLFEFADKPLNKILFGWWASKHPGATVQMFQKAVKAAGIHGILGEMGEEEVAKLIKAVGQVEDYRLPTGKELAAQAIAFGVPGATHSVLSYAGKSSEEKVKTIEDIGKTIGQLDMSKNPDAAPNVQKIMSEIAGSDKFYIPIKEFSQHFEENGMNPADVAAQLTGDKRAFEDAQRSGNDLEVDAAKYYSVIGPTDHNKALAPVIRDNDPNAMNHKEFEELTAQPDEAVKAVEKEQSEQAQFEQGAREIGQDIEQQLLATGQPFIGKTEASTYGKLVERGVATWAKRLGISPAEFFKRFGFSVEGGQEQGVDLQETKQYNQIVPEDSEIESLKKRVLQLETELRTSEKTGLRNQKAFEEDLKTGQYDEVGAFDIDAFKKMNESLGHEAVDKFILPTIGGVILKSGGDARIYHRSGDEFSVLAKKGGSEAILKDLQDKLENTNVLVTTPQGTFVVKGIGISYGIGGSYELADEAVSAQKAERTTAGKREEGRSHGPSRRIVQAAVHTRAATGVDKGGQGERQAGGQGEPATRDANAPDAGRAGGREDIGGEVSLAGLPPNSTGAQPRIIAAAQRYAVLVGLDANRQTEYVQVDEARGTRIGEAYESMEHNPSDPKVKAAYRSLIDETLAQFQIIKDLGIQMDFIPEGENPYPGGPTEAMLDLDRNNHLWFFPTSSGFGTERTISDNPLLEPTDEYIGGRRLLANDVFRIVHDIFGHYKEGFGFGPRGEENAWQSHVRMYSPQAAQAMTSETRGQNSWVNFSKKKLSDVATTNMEIDKKSMKMTVGEWNRKNPKQTIFADQKAGLLPKWVLTEGLNEGKAFSQTSNKRVIGKISFGTNSARIKLLKDANFSTFIHELGHDYFEMHGTIAAQADAPQDIKDDWATLMKFLGKEVGDKITEADHEKIADANIQYMLEGKAPSPSLRSVFSKFRVWLLSVVRLFRHIGLTDEVREVFDRWYATQSEIDLVRREQNLDPLFKDPFAVLGKKAEQYQKAVLDARRVAEEQFGARMIKDFTREREDWYKEERAKTRNEVVTRLNDDRQYKALAALTTGKYPDGTEYPEGQTPQRLNRSATISIFGKDYMAGLPAIFEQDGGLHPSTAADIYGYDGAVRLLDSMKEAEPLNKHINNLTDAAMKEKYPDIMDQPDEMHDEALKAAMNDKQSEVLRMEMEELLNSNFSNFKQMTKKLIERMPTSKAAKAYARSEVGKVSVKNLNPTLYQAAVRRSAKQAAAAWAKGDFHEAFVAKRNEYLNHEKFIAAVDAKDNVAKSMDKFKRLDKSDEKISRSREIDMVNIARAILAQFGISKSEKPMAHYLSPLEKYNPDMYQTALAFLERTSGQPTNYRDVPYADFAAMADTVDNLWHLARRENQIRIEGELLDKDLVLVELEKRIAELNTKEGRETYRRTKTKWEKAKIGMMGIRAALRRVEPWADAMGPVFTKYIFRPVSNACVSYRIKKRDAMMKYLDIVTKHGKLDTKEIKAPELDWTFHSKAELRAAMLHRGNASNFSKLLRGYKWGIENEEGILDTSLWDTFQSRAEKEGIITKEDWEYCQATWDLMEELKPEAQKAHKEMYGYYFDEVTAHEFVTSFGKFKGGYVPAKLDPFESHDIHLLEEKDIFDTGNDGFAFPTTGTGSTKSRNEKFAGKLSLNLGFVPSHIDWVLRFSHIQPAVRDVGRLLIDRDFRTNIDSLDPTVIDEMLMPWLRRSAQQRVETPMRFKGGAAASKFFRELRKRTGLQIMTGNIINTLQQPVGLALSNLKVPAKYLRNSIWDYTQHPTDYVNGIIDKSDFMKTRATTQMIEIQNTVDDLLTDTTKYEKVIEFANKHGYFMQAGVQNVVDKIVWGGAYEQAQEEGVSEKEAVLRADAAVRETQGDFSPENISSFEAGNAFVRCFSLFYSYFNMQANLLGTEFAKISRDMGMRKNIGRAFFIYVMGFAIPCILAEVIMRGIKGDIGGDDDDFGIDDAMSIFFGSQIRTASAFVPFVGQIVNAGLNQLDKKSYNDRISGSPVMGILESSVGNVGNLYKWMSGRTVDEKKAIKDFLTFMGLMTGIPLAPLSKPLGYTIGAK